MEVASQKQLRNHGAPPFCYLCGKPLDGALQVNGDHCPPKGFFAPKDRSNFPIILPTHEACNNEWHRADELVSILVDALHIKQKSTDTALTRKLDAEIVPFREHYATAISNFPIAPMAARIVRGMHALLYKEFLPVNTKSKFHVPLPEADPETLGLRAPLDQAFVFSGVIRKAILTKTADVVRAYNGKFKYACTWTHLDDGTPFCIMSFDIYAFHALSPPMGDFPRTFVGMYLPRMPPQSASWLSGLEIEMTREEVLDPFAAGP